MQLRKSVREKPNKKTVVSSDEEELEEVLTKKTKLTSKGSYIATEAISTEEYGFGKRVRRKNATFKNYKLYDDSDSDYDAGPRGSRKSGTRKKRGSKPREATQIEFLLDWKREINISVPPVTQKSSKVANTKKVLDADLKQYGSDLQALFININWWTKHNPSGVKIEDFKRLDLNKKLMKNGIVFIWSEKEILGRLIKIMEEKGFFYIENFVIALLDASKADTNIPKEKEQEIKPKVVSTRSSPVKGRGRKVISPEDSESSTTTESTKTGKVFKEDGNENDFFLHNLEKYPVLQASQLLYEGTSEYLKISKRVLMMFRRADSKENNLELRHQRTCDALFDLVDPNVSYGASDLRTKEYVYKLIETLLPKAAYNPEDGALKMMELWADQTRPREGWISVCEKL